MPNELFGSVGFALSADRRRPETLARNLTNKVRNRQVDSAQARVGGRLLELCPYEMFGDLSWIGFSYSDFTFCARFTSQLAPTPGNLTEPPGPSPQRLWRESLY